MQRRENGYVHFFADTHDNRIAVLYTGFEQRFFVERGDDKGVFGVFSHGADFFLVFVQNDYVRVRSDKFGGESIAESAQTYYSV